MTVQRKDDKKCSVKLSTAQVKMIFLIKNYKLYSF